MKKGYLGFLMGLKHSLQGVYGINNRKPFKWTLKPREKSVRNSKDTAVKETQIRRRKAKKLSQLSKSKRRAVYHYNLRHSIKMYTRGQVA